MAWMVPFCLSVLVLLEIRKKNKNNWKLDTFIMIIVVLVRKTQCITEVFEYDNESAALIFHNRPISVYCHSVIVPETVNKYYFIEIILLTGQTHMRPLQMFKSLLWIHKMV